MSENKGYFGKGCPHFVGQWEDESTYRESGFDYKQFGPVLCFCNHKSNPEKTEGNCRERICPLEETEKLMEAAQRSESLDLEKSNEKKYRELGLTSKYVMFFYRFYKDISCSLPEKSFKKDAEHCFKHDPIFYKIVITNKEYIKEIVDEALAQKIDEINQLFEKITEELKKL